MKKQPKPYLLNSISDLHRILELPKPEHPLVSVIHFNTIKCFSDERFSSVVYNFYSVCIKKDFKGKVKYGQNYYDFDEGVMTFFSPGQVISAEITDDMALSGWWLVIHPDFLLNYTLSKTIKEFGYFSYAVNEALHLSDKEEKMIEHLMKTIAQEYSSVLDGFSQDVIIAQIALLLHYANRFYNPQFLTRKHANNDLLGKLENLLDGHFNDGQIVAGLPTVQYLSAQLNVSPNYLSDMLRTLTGQNTQQHIHGRLIETAKRILSTTSLSISEIAFMLGFQYPQSFNKLFKSKTNMSPSEFRATFN